MRHLNKVLLALLFALSCSAHALSSDKDQPIELAADSVDVDEGKGVSTYKGNVDLRQGSMKLLATVPNMYAVLNCTREILSAAIR